MQFEPNDHHPSRRSFIITATLAAAGVTFPGAGNSPSGAKLIINPAGALRRGFQAKGRSCRLF